MKRFHDAIRWIVCASMTALLFGCGSNTVPTSSETAEGRAIDEFLYADGFDFRPPLDAGRSLGMFNAEATPVIEIYAGSEAEKTVETPLLKRFETADIAVETDHFQANWDTKADPGGLPEGTTTCVIEVWWETAGACELLGYVDCSVDKVAGKGKKVADPSEYVFALQEGRTLPIKFAIDQTVPAPVELTVTDVSPASGQQSDTVALTVSGTGFKPETTLALGDGITIVAVNVVSDTSLVATASIAADAVAGPRDVKVSNPCDKSATLSGAFSVEDSAPPVTTVRVITGADMPRGGTGIMEFTFDANGGTPTGVFATMPYDSGEQALPQSIAIGPDGYLYVGCQIEYGSSRSFIYRFNAANGTYLDTYVPANGGGLNGPTQIAFGPDDSLYVVNQHAGVIKRYMPSPIGTVGQYDPSSEINTAANGISHPWALAMGPDGHLYVGGYQSAGIHVYQADGTYVGVLADSSSHVTQVLHLSFSADGSLYAATATGKVAEFGPTGYWVKDFQNPLLGVVTAAAIGPDGKLYVADGNGRAYQNPANELDEISRFDRSTASLIDYSAPLQTQLSEYRGIVFLP